MSMPMTGGAALGAQARDRSEIRSQGRYLRFGPFQLDLLREELSKHGARVHIPSKVYLVLLALLERAGEIVTRQDLRARLWPGGTFVNYDANVNTSVNKLRLVLGDSPDQPIYVETIPRQGYSFVGPVERTNEPEPYAEPKAVPSATKVQTRPPRATAGILQGRLPGFFTSGWAAALLLCGILIGMGIVLLMHRPS